MNGIAPSKPKDRPTARDRAIAVRSLSADDPARLIRSLSRYLSDRSPQVRSTAVDKIRDEKLVGLEGEVLSLLLDKKSYVRYSAVECLGILHEDEGIQANWLYPLLADSDYMTRIEALESLAQIGDKSALPLISKLLKDDEPLVRAYAATAIEDLDGEEHAGAIRRAMKRETDDRAKVGLAGALFYFGDANQFSLLLTLLTSSVYTTRCAAANTIRSFDLTPAQLQSAIEAVNYALQNPIYRGDASTMDRVLKELLLKSEAPSTPNH